MRIKGFDYSLAQRPWPHVCHTHSSRDRGRGGFQSAAGRSRESSRSCLTSDRGRCYTKSTICPFNSSVCHAEIQTQETDSKQLMTNPSAQRAP